MSIKKILGSLLTAIILFMVVDHFLGSKQTYMAKICEIKQPPNHAALLSAKMDLDTSIQAANDWPVEPDLLKTLQVGGMVRITCTRGFLSHECTGWGYTFSPATAKDKEAWDVREGSHWM